MYKKLFCIETEGKSFKLSNSSVNHSVLFPMIQRNVKIQQDTWELWYKIKWRVLWSTLYNLADRRPTRPTTLYDRLSASSCRPSVRPSVCQSVCLWRSALWLSGLVYRAKSCTGVLTAPSRKFPFVPSDTFAV